jgi:hypothetical protein
MGEAGPVEVGADITPCEEAVADCQKQIDGAEEERQKTEFNVRHAMTRSIRVLSGVIGITMSAFNMVGGSLGPMGNAIMGMVTSTISALQAVTIAMASNPITAAIAGITATFSIYLSTQTLIEVSRGIDRSKDEMSRVQQSLRMAHSAYTLFKGAEM